MQTPPPSSPLKKKKSEKEGIAGDGLSPCKGTEIETEVQPLHLGELLHFPEPHFLQGSRVNLLPLGFTGWFEKDEACKAKQHTTRA